jgi:D-lactate dehydrogenase
MPNVLITGHQAFFTQEALTTIADTTLQSVTDFADGTKPRFALFH